MYVYIFLYFSFAYLGVKNAAAFRRDGSIYDFGPNCRSTLRWALASTDRAECVDAYTSGGGETAANRIIVHTFGAICKGKSPAKSRSMFCPEKGDGTISSRKKSALDSNKFCTGPTLVYV